MQTSRQTRQRYFCVNHLTASHLGLMLFSLTFAFVLALSFSTPITSARITNQQAQDVRVLLPGSPVDGQLSRDEAHSYRLAITSGQFLRVVVAQRGITVSVKILDPNGQQLAEATNPTSRHSLALSVIATMSGDHRLEVVAAKVPGAAANGRHVISIEELKGPAHKRRNASRSSGTSSKGDNCNLVERQTLFARLAKSIKTRFWFFARLVIDCSRQQHFSYSATSHTIWAILVAPSSITRKHFQSGALLKIDPVKPRRLTV